MNTEIEQNVIERLRALADESYRDFQAALVPSIDKERILGVRTPALRKLAAEFSKTAEASRFMDVLPHRYYDENNLHAFLIERIGDFAKTRAALDRFLPYVDNWATCDGMSPKIFAKHPNGRVLAAKQWLTSTHPYTVRYGIVLLMKHDLGASFRPEYPALIAEIRSEEYYVKMAQAWYFATALALQYEATLPYLTEKRLDPWVHDKTITKAIESNRISTERKQYLRTLKTTEVSRNGSHTKDSTIQPISNI